jgi:threonine dehydrogenase-like Zn-dependent dehydrogenase
VVVEATGRESGLKTAIELVRPRGTIVLKSTIAGDYRIDLAPVVVNEVRIVGSRCGQFPPAIEALKKRIVDVRRLIDRVYPLEGYEEAFEEAASPNALKVLLRP